MDAEVSGFGLNVNRHYERISNALRFVEQHMEFPVTLDYVAQQYGVSPFYFHRLFREISGETPGEYIRRLRLELGARHLAYSDVTIDTVSDLTGYESGAAFSRAFKRHFDASPGDWRDSFRNLAQSISRAENRKIVQHKPYCYRWVERVCVACVRRHGRLKETLKEAIGVLTNATCLPCETQEPPRYIVLIHDVPSITPDKRQRIDFGIVVKDNFIPRGPVYLRWICSGNYARFFTKESPDKIVSLCDYILTSWAVSARATLANIPLLLWYKNIDEPLSVEVNVPVMQRAKHNILSPH